MPISKQHPLSHFFNSLQRLSFSRQLFIFSLLLLSFFYPGQNQLQTLTLSPGLPYVFASTSGFLANFPLSDSTPPPKTSARSIFIQDLASFTPLLALNPDQELLPASTTKLMTALVALDHYQLDEVVTITAEDHAIGHTMNLFTGEQLTIRSLLAGLLIESGNDAALTLALHHPDGYAGFVQAMNDKALALGLTDTSYRNPSGVESYNHYTSARDLAVLAAYAIKQPTIAELTSTESLLVTDLSGNYAHYLNNTNELLGQLEGVRGLKTGWTENAGECLVTYVEREGRGVVIVVLGSRDRFGDTTSLIDWVYSHHTWVPVE